MTQILSMLARASAPLSSILKTRLLLPVLTSVIVVCGSTTSTSTFAASFNCSKANSATEKIICGDAELSGMDDRLGKTYRQARMKAVDRREFAVRSDDFWRWREKNCQTRACLLDWYQQRQTALDAELAGTIPPPTTLPTLTSKASTTFISDNAQSQNATSTVTPEQVQAALEQVQKLIAEPTHGNHLFLVMPPALAANVSVPMQGHYIDMTGGEYVYEDLSEATAVDARPRVVVRYRGKVHGEYTLEVQKRAGKLRYTCDSDCTYIKQLTLPGYGLHDLDMLKNDHVSLASIIMRDAMNGLLTQSD